jgi:hypothetical protein
MNEPAIPVEPLEYYTADETAWKPVVRACSYLAIAHAALLLLVVASQFAIAFRLGQARLLRDAQNVFGVGMELLLAIASVAVIATGAGCIRFARGANRGMLFASAALVAVLVLRDGLRIWTVLTFPGGRVRGFGLTEMVSYVAGLASEWLVPLLLIWLMRRPEARRLFA